MQRKLLVIVGILGVITIIIGAFGAHTLKSHITEAQLQTFQTSVSYQMMHVLALLVICSLMQKSPTKWLKLASYFFISGIVLFSGSLYLLACKELVSIIPVGILGPATPIGGLCFIVGWLLLVVHGLKLRT